MSTFFVPKAKQEQFIAVEAAQKLQNISDFLSTVDFIYVADKQFIFDVKTKLLWMNVGILKQIPTFDSWKDGDDWTLPTRKQLIDVVKKTRFPLKSGTTNRLFDRCYWVIKDNRRIDLDNFNTDSVQYSNSVISVNNNFADKTLTDCILAFIQKKFNIEPIVDSTNDIKYLDFIKDYNFLNSYYRDNNNGNVGDIFLSTWLGVDYISTRLPKLDELRFTDAEQGIWEFYTRNIPQHILDANYQHIETDLTIRGRNSVLDIQDAKVGIDFGTSSTVVAIQKNGKKELLRIGLQEKDFKKHAISENDFENPTILEFIDINKLLSSWHREVYRPLVDWDDIHFSHEARMHFRENNSDPNIVSSIFVRLKQWALRDANQPLMNISDQNNGKEHEFSILKTLNPTKGQPLNIEENYPELDPIELYAWFLGMNINWRERGIFLTYYMSFPVTYSIDVKERILSSFRRGLLRSFPESLIYSDKINDFKVQELASEPAAFAASALSALKIEPTENGTAYAVFDFGGGTTDFDFGVYRLPTPEEYDEEWDHVIEHFGSSGDLYLGGENLLENITYLTFKHNQNYCRDHDVVFTKPIDADRFIGSERLITKTQVAYTNTTLLMSKLRPIWEGNESTSDEGILQLTLLNRSGERIECEIQIPRKVLTNWLENRISDGFKNFFISLESSFKEQLGYIPDEINILLAGNSCRSNIVQDLLELKVENGESNQPKKLITTTGIGGFLASASMVPTEKNKSEEKVSQKNKNRKPKIQKLVAEIFKHECPKFIIHKPLISDEHNPYSPNTKTGVALGLLNVSPGETLKVINHAQKSNYDSPFQYFVGVHRRNNFIPILKRGDNYNEWKELGAVREGIFTLLFTTLPQALSGLERGANGLVEKNISFSGSETKGKKVVAKITSPNTIELGLVSSIDNIDEISQHQSILLENK